MHRARAVTPPGPRPAWAGGVRDAFALRAVAASTRLEGAVRAVGQTVAGRAARRPDRGDVPGWVLVTLMTAGLVIVLWGLARQQLASVFQKAISSVTKGP
jgi:hypothetical protein